MVLTGSEPIGSTHEELRVLHSPTLDDISLSVSVSSNGLRALSTQPSPVPRDCEHPISTPNACAIRPIPTRAPPPAPMAGPNGFWRVGGYTAQGCEILTYHPHTHTPITTPRAKRFEHSVRPSADDFSTKAMSEPRRIHTDARACFDAHAMPQHCNPNRPKTHTQPPVPPSATSRDGFWTCAVSSACSSSQ